MNQKLLDLQTHWDKSLISSYVKENPCSLSRPFAYGVSEEYITADFKLMVVGQEAAGFSAYEDPTAWDLQRTQQWVVDYTRRQLWGIRVGDAKNGSANCSPFWNFLRNLNKNGLTPSWNNIDKVYQKKTQNTGEKVIRLTDDQRRQFNEALCGGKTLLQREIEISKPDAIIFVTGPYYRVSMETALGGVSLGDKVPTPGRIWTDISSKAGLGIPCLWTYHPRYLRLRSLGLKKYADEIAETIKQYNKHTELKNERE